MNIFALRESDIATLYDCRLAKISPSVIAECFPNCFTKNFYSALEPMFEHNKEFCLRILVCHVYGTDPGELPKS